MNQTYHKFYYKSLNQRCYYLYCEYLIFHPTLITKKKNQNNILWMKFLKIQWFCPVRALWTVQVFLKVTDFMPGYLLGLYSAGPAGFAGINCLGQLLDICLIQTGHFYSSLTNQSARTSQMPPCASRESVGKHTGRRRTRRGCWLSVGLT